MEVPREANGIRQSQQGELLQMGTLGKVLGVVLAIIEAVLEALLSVTIRFVLWIFIAAWFSPWIAILLLVAVVLGPVIRVIAEGSLDELRIVGDVALFALSWMSIYGFTGDWRAASGLVGAIFAFILFNEYL